MVPGIIQERKGEQERNRERRKKNRIERERLGEM
jgi:hypothetical protein